MILMNNLIKQDKDNKAKTYYSKKILDWYRIKWLILSIPPIIFVFRGIQLFIIGDPGTIIQLVGTTWGWFLLISEFLFSIIALIGSFFLWIKELKIQYRKLSKILTVISFTIAFILHLTRFIHFLISI